LLNCCRQEIEIEAVGLGVRETGEQGENLGMGGGGVVGAHARAKKTRRIQVSQGQGKAPCEGVDEIVLLILSLLH
jgi:hypothetical protein